MEVEKEQVTNYSPNRKFVREGLSFKKSYLLLLILFLQLVLLIVTYIYFVQAFTWIYVISAILSFLTSLRVLLFTKNPAAKSSWILFIMLFPTFGFIIYFLAGGSDLHPLYKRRLFDIDEYANSHLVKNEIGNVTSYERENIRYLGTVTNANAYSGRATKYYALADDIFPDIIRALKAAKHTIYVEFFIISRGDLFTEIINILIEKANNGVDVRVIYDGFGSKDLMNRQLRKTLKTSKIKIKPFVPITPVFSFFLNYRNHRKLVIVDHEVAFLGGFNLADEYVNIHKRFGHWKDSGLQIVGASVYYFSLEFLKMWIFVTREKVDLSFFDQQAKSKVDNKNGIVVPYVTAPYQGSSVARSFYINAINNARKSIAIMSPYLIIDEAIIDLLITKAASGITVNIILPGIPDKKIVYALSKSTGEFLSERGCNVYVYTPGFLHAKNLLIDDESAIVGSINFDFRSFYQQYENAVYLTNDAAVKAISADFNHTISVSKRITKSRLSKLPLTYRIYIGLLKWVSPLM